MAYPPKRPNSHIIDTEACSFVTSLMPSENWVVRDLTERDFGIDKIFERFENGFATGELMAIQVKGTNLDTPRRGPRNRPHPQATRR